jgi:hypothetical protein
MKRLFPTSLALLLAMGSLGHVFAAAFCPRMLGHNCCVTKAVSSGHSSQSHQHMQGMVMDGMDSGSMRMDGSDMLGMTMEDAATPPSSLDNEVKQFSSSEELLPANLVEEPVGACPHCLSHSGVQNAPISSASAPDESNKHFAPIQLPVSRFVVRPAMTLAQIGLPSEHGPPGNGPPRHILLNVFLI